MSSTTSGSPLPASLVAVIVVFAAAATTTSWAAADVAAASTNKQPPASPAALDFIRAQCNETWFRRPVAATACYDLLLPYAASINGSYNKASLAIVTVIVSKLSDLARDLRDYDEPDMLEGCIKVLDEAIAGSKAALPKLDHLATLADDEVSTVNPDLLVVWKWLYAIDQNFVKCWDGGLKRITDRIPSSSPADLSEFAAAAIFFNPRPGWTPSPDGATP